MKPPKLLPFVILSLCFFVNLSFYQRGTAQSKVEVFAVINRVDNSIRLDTVWKFHAGNNIAWASPEYNDSGWALLNTSFIITNDTAHPFKNTGWFRMWIEVDSSVWDVPLAMKVSQKGASEFYLDGKLHHSFGHPDADISKEVRMDPHGVPVFIRFTAKRHLLAVRYSNHHAISDFRKYQEGSAGFSVEIAPLDKAIQDVVTNSLALTVFMTVFGIFFITLAFLHFLLFLFYHAQKSNLWYSIVVAMLASFFIIPVISIINREPGLNIIIQYSINFAIPIAFASLQFLLYSFFYKPLPRYSWITFAVLVIVILFKWFGIEFSERFLFLFIVASTIESTRVIIVSIYRKKAGSWIIGVGIIMFLLFTTFVLSIMAFAPGGNFVLRGTSMLTIIFGITLLLAIVSIPLSMSIYLAWDFARTNKDLQKQLVQVKMLSEKTIEQEREKKKILEGQKEELEILVAKRTAEVVEQKNRIQEQNTLLEEKNQNISDSIQYAQRIQQAMLPPDIKINNILPNNIVIYKPKDIVSGDFYFVEKVDDRIIFSAVDCTGHGVPGALMSVMGFKYLEQAVAEKKIVSPAAILSFLDRGVHNTLRQAHQTLDVKDGMDLALCVLNRNTFELKCAGAYNSVIVIRNGELVELKGDHIPIGGLAGKYTEHTMQLQQNDLIYMTTDGFEDQFGGPNEKKFKSKHLRKLLLSIHQKPLEEQKINLEAAIETWRGSCEQTDDICVVGVRI